MRKTQAKNQASDSRTPKKSLGLARVKTEGSVSGVAGNTSQTSSNAYGGLGVGYAVNKAVSLDAALDFTKGKLVGQSGNLRLFSVGATFNF